MEYYTKVLRDYAVFTGRARRKEYWMFTLVNILVYAAVMLIVGAISETLSSVILGIYGLAVLIPCIAVGIRRLHDTNRSGWWLLISLVPFIGSVVLLVFFVLEGTLGANQYGPDPKEGAAPVATPVPPTETPQN